MDVAALEAALPATVVAAIGSPFTAAAQVYVDDRPRRATQAAAVCWVRPGPVRPAPGGIGATGEERDYVFHLSGASQDTRQNPRVWAKKLRAYLDGHRLGLQTTAVSGLRRAQVVDEELLAPDAVDPALGPVRGLAEVEVTVRFSGIVTA